MICNPCRSQQHKTCDRNTCVCQHKEGPWEHKYDIPKVETPGPTRDSKAGESFDG